MRNSSGFYHVYMVKVKNKSNKKGYKIMWEYSIKDNLIKDKIRANNLQILKIKVLDKGYLWGIVDVEKAKKSATKCNNDIKLLVGRYGEQL